MLGPQRDRLELEAAQRAAALAAAVPVPPLMEEESRLNPTGLRLEDLEQLSTLGEGTFGRVKLVRAPDGRAFALKLQQKQAIVENGQCSNIMNEKNVMAALQHPFILRLEATFQDRDVLYMLLELVPGGELFTLLTTNEEGILGEAHARFYAAGVIDAFRYSHGKNILYRDLKPENLLIDKWGYIKVVDFGFGKVVPDRTFTLCGTPDYFAPETVTGKGYDKSVDYWALGVLIYEMLYLPFPPPYFCRNMHAPIVFTLEPPPFTPAYRM